MKQGKRYIQTNQFFNVIVDEYKCVKLRQARIKTITYVATFKTRHAKHSFKRETLTHEILLLLAKTDLSLESRGKPSSLRISFSEKSIVSNWSCRKIHPTTVQYNNITSQNVCILVTCLVCPQKVMMREFGSANLTEHVQI